MTFFPSTRVSVEDARAPATRRATFRLAHYLIIGGLMFGLAIGNVWVRVSSVRLGYLVDETIDEGAELRAERDRLAMELEMRTNPLQLRSLIAELPEPLVGGEGGGE